MSDQTIKATQAMNIALISQSNSFHSTLLAKFIGEQLGAKCDIVTSEQHLPQGTNIVLLDCFQVSIEELNNVLRELSILTENHAIALLNAEQKEEHENLLDWPCISGLFYLDTEEDQLIRGIQQLAEGDYWVPRRLLHQFFNKHRQNKGKSSHAISTSNIQLTNREREILRMIKEGMSNSAVSESLSLSEHTVKSHLYNIYKKIGVRNRMEASNWARDQLDLDLL